MVSPSYNHTTAKHPNIPNTMYNLRKAVPEDGITQSETCRASNRKQSLITEICASCWFIYILWDDARCIQRQTTSKYFTPVHHLLIDFKLNVI